MAWVWGFSKESDYWGADIDYEASAPLKSIEYLSDVPVDPNLRPVYRSNTNISRFRKLHCPPIGVAPAVDHVWRDIILEFVPADRVQFLPVRLIAQREISDDFSWVIPFDRVRCIDPVRSEVTQKREIPGLTLIFGVENIVHQSSCLGSSHLARDEQKTSHLILSDQLKEALAATGVDSMFYQPETAPPDILH